MNKKSTLNKEIQVESLINNILINFGMGVFGYIVLGVLWKTYLANVLVFTTAGIFFVCSVLCFVFTKTKSAKFKNYGYMFLAFTLATLFVKLSVIVSSIVGMNNFMKIIQIKFFENLFNGRKEVMVIATLGALYLVGILIYDLVLISKINKK